MPIDTSTGAFRVAIRTSCVVSNYHGESYGVPLSYICDTEEDVDQIRKLANVTSEQRTDYPNMGHSVIVMHGEIAVPHRK